MYSLVNIGKSHQDKNRTLSRLISNLSRLNWSNLSERNIIYCFSMVFTLLQQEEVPQYLCTPIIFPVLFLKPGIRF